MAADSTADIDVHGTRIASDEGVPPIRRARAAGLAVVRTRAYPPDRVRTP